MFDNLGEQIANAQPTGVHTGRTPDSLSSGLRWSPCCCLKNSFLESGFLNTEETV